LRKGLNMKNCEFRFFHNDAEAARAVAAQWVARVAVSPATHTVAFSGGRIAPVLFSAIVDEAHARKAPLSQVHFFWADERCVPPEDPESNFRLANEHLFQPMAIALDKIHRIRGELDGRKACEIANAEIRRVIPAAPEALPALDVVILGMGPDGHTASLMPDATEEIQESKDPYVYVETQAKPPPRRISLTYAALAAAKNVWGLIAGEGKEKAVRDSLRTGARTPFGRVLESRKETPIFSSVPLS